MSQTVEDQLKELSKQLSQLTRVQQLKDAQISRQQQTIDTLNKRISTMASQIHSLSNSLSRMQGR